MRSQEWIDTLQRLQEEGLSLSQVPLGWDKEKNPIFSHRKNRPDRYCHTCVTGACRTSFLRDTVCALLEAYGVGGARVLVLSPKREYLQLLSAKGVDVLVPYIGVESQFEKMKAFVLSEVEARKQNARLPRLFIVIDGLESLPFLPKDNAFTYLRKLIADLSGGAEILTAVNFKGSIFDGFEGAFVGVGNSLISADSLGKADVAYVGDDCQLDFPQAITYPTYFEGK